MKDETGIQVRQVEEKGREVIGQWGRGQREGGEGQGLADAQAIVRGNWKVAGRGEA